jgi:hypothetical protein
MEYKIMISSFIPQRYEGVIGQEPKVEEVGINEHELITISTRTLHAPKAEAGYLKTARRLFLEGTSFSAPVDAVISGARTIEEWCDCLRQLRLEYGVHAHRHGDSV